MTDTQVQGTVTSNAAKPDKPCPLLHGDRCENCRKFGNNSLACKATVSTTPDGISPKSGSVEFKQHGERTQRERVEAATNVLQEVLADLRARNSRRAAKRAARRKKRVDEGVTARQHSEMPL
eukprot:GHVS01025228.1.p1 GENE.GHVS01025228.1~~GHVS01025228.1.p1  ORF type:complete len:122 (-),score=15.57 GHVS01025228.1:221-586(-)